MKPKKSTHPLAARVKKLMQADEDIGKIAQASPVLVGRATELFIRHIVEKAASLATARNAAQVSPAHLKAAIAGEEMLDFLKGIVESVPDHGTEEEAAPQEKQPKRRRKADGELASPTKRTKGTAAKMGAEECKPEVSELPESATAAAEPRNDAKPLKLQAGDAASAPVKAEEAAPAAVKVEPAPQLPSKSEPAAEQESQEQQPPSADHPGPPVALPGIALPGIAFPVAPAAVQEEDDYDAEE